MNILNAIITFVVGVVVALAVFWVGNLFGLGNILLGGVNILGLVCFVVFLSIVFGGYRYLGVRTR